jgi:homoserine dehydrogenase
MTHAFAAVAPARKPDTVQTPDAETTALLQLDLSDPVEAASAVYRQTRRGRRVVAVAGGAADASALLAEALDAVGVASVSPAPGQSLLSDGMVLVAGPETTAHPAAAPAPGQPLRVALAGCGVVGGGVLQRLAGDPRFQVVGVLVRNPAKTRDVAVAPELLLSDPSALLALKTDVLIEAVTDGPAGLALIRAALEQGVAVVSANKQAVCDALPELHALAETAGVGLAYSAAVGGGSPLIETVRRAASLGEVASIEAVLNGTCNFILNRLAEGGGFDAALTAAQAAGFAEADPSADVEGLDAAAKLAILAWEATSRSLGAEQIVRQTLSADAVLPQGRVRQISRFDARTGEAAVTFEAVDATSPFFDLPDEANALIVTLTDGRAFFARGRGAGRRPTTESVWADLIDLVERREL